MVKRPQDINRDFRAQIPKNTMASLREYIERSVHHFFKIHAEESGGTIESADPESRFLPPLLSAVPLREHKDIDDDNNPPPYPIVFSNSSSDPGSDEQKRKLNVQKKVVVTTAQGFDLGQLDAESAAILTLFVARELVRRNIRKVNITEKGG